MLKSFTKDLVSADDSRAMYYVYLLRSIDEIVPFYIGISTIGSYRVADHLDPGRLGNKNTLVRQHSQKLRSEGKSVVHEVVAVTRSRESAADLEKFLIASYGRRDLGKGPLLNLTDGGLGGPTGWKPTPEIIAKCVESRRKNPRKKGYEVPKNSKRVRSYSSNGELLKIYACARRAADDLQISYKLVSLICLGRRDRTKTPDNQVIRFRFDSDNIDRLPPLEKIQKKQKIVGHVIAKYSLKGELLEIYPSLAEASRKNPGISPSNIWECINGNVKKSKGFIWKRASSSSDIASEVEA